MTGRSDAEHAGTGIAGPLSGAVRPELSACAPAGPVRSGAGASVGRVLSVYLLPAILKSLSSVPDYLLLLYSLLYL